MFKKYVNIISSILIFLIITFPVSSSMQGFVYGQNKLPNFSKGLNDKLTFEVLLDPVEGSTISLNEIYLYFLSFNTQLSFNSDFCVESYCENTNDPNLPSTRCVCSSNWDLNEKMNIVFRYDHENNGYIDSSVIVNFVPDYKKPYFEEVDLIQENDKIKVNYKVKDESCNNCPENICSGIKEIIVSDSSGQISTFEIDTNLCLKSGFDFFDYNKEGDVTFNLIVRDRLWESTLDNENHQSISTRTVSVDFSEPIISSNFNIYKNNKKITHISSEELFGTNISFIVEDDNLDKISAKLSNLGNNNDFSLNDWDNRCILINGNSYNCSFQNVHIKNESVKLEVTAIDKMNNVKTSLLSSGLILDDIKPNVEFIGTLANNEEQSYIKNGENTFIVIINEDGSGISKENIKLNLNSIFSDNFESTADECLLEEGKWVCKWFLFIDDINDKKSYTIYLSKGLDNAGNVFENINPVYIIGDIIQPIIENIEIVAVDEIGPGERTYYQSGDILKIRAYIENEGSLIKKAEADFSGIYSSNNLIEGECSNFDEKYTLCKWQTENIKSGNYIANLKFYFTDFALNKEINEEKITVYGISDKIPDNFNVNVKELIPSSINRLVASILPNPPGYKIIVPFKLEGGSQSIDILRYHVEDCVIIADDEESEIGFKELFKSGANPTPEPIPLLDVNNKKENELEFIFNTFSPQDINQLNDFKVNCKIKIYQSEKLHSGKFVFSRPEIKNLTFDVNVVDSALSGRPEDRIIEKINKKTDDTSKGYTKFLEGSLNAIEFLEKICSLASIITMVWDLAASIEAMGAVSNIELIYNSGCKFYEWWGKNIVRYYYGKNYVNDLDPSECDVNRPQDREFTALPNRLKDFNFNIRDICAYLSCEYSNDLADTITNFPLEGGSFVSQDTLENKYLLRNQVPLTAPPFDSKNSIIISAATLCVPGVIYNLYKYKEINCDYVLCLKESAINGLPISLCDARRSQATCLTITGEIIEVVDIFRLFKELSLYLENTIENLLPTVLKNVLDKMLKKDTLCSERANDNVGNKVLYALVCSLPRAYYTYVDSTERLQAIFNLDDEFKKIDYDEESSCKIVFSDEFKKGLEPLDYET